MSPGKVACLGGPVRAWCKAARPKFRCAKELGMSGGSHDGICVMLPVRVDTCAGPKRSAVGVVQSVLKEENRVQAVSRLSKRAGPLSRRPDHTLRMRMDF